jgi:hypothetical protein
MDDGKRESAGLVVTQGEGRPSTVAFAWSQSIGGHASGLRALDASTLRALQWHCPWPSVRLSEDKDAAAPRSFTTRTTTT